VTTINDPMCISVPVALARRLARGCTLATDGHEWEQSNVDVSREVLSAGVGPMVVRAMARRLARAAGSSPGWVVLTLPAYLDHDQLRRVSAGLLAALGRPFNSIDDGGRLWIGRESCAANDAASFGGFGHNGLHVDAPNVERVPDYTSLLVLRADPAGGGASLLAQLHPALAMLDERDHAALREPVFFEGRADRLRGVGAPRLPFPVVQDVPTGGRPWIRWAAKMLTDGRNTRHVAVLERFAEALATTTTAVALARGQLLVVDQQRAAHGRTALGDQHGLVDGTRRWLVQAKATHDPGAPAQLVGERDV
jgi:TfdA family taurine catabolism dioxygenase TauD